MKENVTATQILELASKGYTVTRPQKQQKIDPALRIPKSRFDNWVNETNEFGIKHSTNDTYFANAGLIGSGQLNTLYQSDWVSRKGIDAPAEDMTRKGIKFLHNDDDESSQDKVEDLEDLLVDTYDMGSKAKEAIAFSRLSGGSVCLFNYGGTTQDQSDPIEDSQKKEIKWIKVFPAWDAIPVSWYTDFDHPKFLQPEHYQILIKGPSVGMTVITHETRLIRMQGRLTTPLNVANNRGWFDSYIQAVYSAIRDFQVASSSASGTMEDFTFKTLGISNLAQMHMEREDDRILDRIYLAAQQMQTGKIGVYDSLDGEAITKIGTPVSGLDSLWDRFGDIICAGFGIPRSIFFSTESGSLGGDSSQSDRDNYFDDIASDQETDLRPWQNEFIHNVSLVEQIDDEDIKYKFNPLREKTSKETTEERKLQSDTDINYINVGVLSPEEVTISRFSKAEPDLDTVLVDFDEREKMAEEQDLEENEEEMDNLVREIHANTTPEEKAKEIPKEKAVKTDAQPITLEVKPVIKVESPTVNVTVPEQKDNTESLKNIDQKLDKLEDKLNEDIEIED